jgi:hypothetical protein
MPDLFIKYCSGNKNQIIEDYTIQINIKSVKDVHEK